MSDLLDPMPIAPLDVADPAGLDLAEVRPIRDQIGSRVRALLADPGAVAGP